MKDAYLAQRIGQRFCLFNLYILNIDSRLSFDFVGHERALTQAEDSESLVWIVLDLVIDFPKLALMSLLTSVRCWLRKKKATLPVK
jgi:hypothetical protein